MVEEWNRRRGRKRKEMERDGERDWRWCEGVAASEEGDEEDEETEAGEDVGGRRLERTWVLPGSLARHDNCCIFT